MDRSKPKEPQHKDALSLTLIEFVFLPSFGDMAFTSFGTEVGMLLGSRLRTGLPTFPIKFPTKGNTPCIGPNR